MTVPPMANVDDSGMFGAVMCLEYIGLWIFATGNRGMYFLENSTSDTLPCCCSEQILLCLFKDRWHYLNLGLRDAVD